MSLKKTTTQAEALTQAQVILLENEVIDRSRAPDRFRLINNQYNALQSWHDQHTGWRIRRSPASVRLIRTPVSFIPGYVFQTLQQPRDFACFVWTLWYAETRLNDGGGPSNGQQFLMSHLAERLEEHSATGYLAPHVAPFDFKRLSDRYSLYRALKTLHELGGLHLEDGSSEEWLNQAGQENALWEFTEITRSLILALDMEQVRLVARTLQGNPKTLSPARLAGSEKVNPLQRAWRTLLLGPVLLKYDDPEAFEALREHQETFNFELGQTYGWQLDLRYEYAMIVRPSGTGLGPFSLLNLTGAADQAALLCCEVIRQKVSGGEWKYPANEGCRVVPESEMAEVFRQVREEHGSRWGSTARKTSFQELLQDVYATLRQAGLMRGPDRSGNVLILPTMARFGVNYPPEEEIGPLQLVIEKPQQLAFDGTPIAPQTRKPGKNGKTEVLGYNTAQAGRILGVSDQSILNWLNTGFLKGERQQRGWVIPEAEVERMKAIRWGTAPKPQLNNSQNGGNGQNGKTNSHNGSNGATKETKPANNPGGERGYNSYEAARWLGVANSTIINWLKKGKLNSEKIGLNWSIPLSELERMKEIGWGTAPKSQSSPQNNSQQGVNAQPAKTNSQNGDNAAANPANGNSRERGYNSYEAGRLLSVGNVTILDWLKKGKINGEKIGLNWSILPAEIERMKELRRDIAPKSKSSPQNNVQKGSNGQTEKPGSQNGSNGATKETKPANGNSGERGYNATDAGRLLGVTEVTILNWLKKGKIKGEKIGLNWSIPPTEIDRIKNSRSLE